MDAFSMAIARVGLPGLCFEGVAMMAWLRVKFQSVTTSAWRTSDDAKTTHIEPTRRQQRFIDVNSQGPKTDYLRHNADESRADALSNRMTLYKNRSAVRKYSRDRRENADLASSDVEELSLPGMWFVSSLRQKRGYFPQV